MISFKVLENDKDIRAFLSENSDATALHEGELFAMLKSNIDSSEGAEIAATVACGCLVLRIYDGEYLFTCPTNLSAEASVFAACDEVRKYARKQEIPVTFIDVTEYELPDVSEPFRLAEVYEMDDEGEVLMVKAMTELDALEDVPSLVGERVELIPLEEKHIPDYARLAKNEKVNALFGYNYKEDYESPNDRLFYDIAEGEREAGIALALAIIHKGEFVGEASMFSFDYQGGAEVAIRLLPEFWGRGLGSDALSQLVSLAKAMDLKRITTAVKKENRASIAMTKKHMNYVRDEDDTVLFEREI